MAENRQREAERDHLYMRYAALPSADVSATAPGSVLAESASFDWINRGAASRSSSGRFMKKAAASLPCRNHQTLKLLARHVSALDDFLRAGRISPELVGEIENVGEEIGNMNEGRAFP